ncbi:hypothetical protein H072_3887 [Dactylellina haptotyla CBS 200.50]|uniref:Aminoglycoside phosphotransferase domain-containing protein n=1 Tax=Dactylellina haptotyla (strain CBS 200.50) TaxID=1284197 RepID=S8ALQ3_DACHA|nr:hypothetical protein H072_3887 [Dactylellina haptotyla CBS 200.50]
MPIAICYKAILSTNGRISHRPPLEDRWAEARISRTLGGILIARAERATIPGLENTWHPNMINCLDIRIWQSFSERVNAHKGKIIANNNYIGLLPGSTVMVKKDPRSVRYPGEGIETENNIYQRIQGHGIGPDFLGHLVEAERMTGFILSFVEDFHPAGPEDLEICQQTLSKLHALGIRHGNISRYNFLVHNNGTKATLIDFARSVRGLAPELEAEMNALPEELEEADPKRVINMNGSLYPINQGELLTRPAFSTSLDGRPRPCPEPDTIP